MLTNNKSPKEVNFQKKLHYIARQLREDATVAENILWQHLRRKQLLGLRFLRQHPIDRFIVDFVCHQKSLVIEVDGGIHNTQRERDEHRSRVLSHHGFRVLRFSNQEVINTVDEVLAKIKESCSPPL